MPPVDLATFSADHLPWVWVPGWILNVAAVSGNTLVIYLIATDRRLQTQVNLFIMSLAIADFCFGLTYFPTFFTCEFYLPCDRELRRIFAAYFAFASLTNLYVMTVDRYVAIVMPFKYVSIVTSQCIVTMVIISWLFPAVFHFLIAVILKQIASKDIFITFKISRVFVSRLIQCMLLLLTTMQMFYIAYKHTKMMATLAFHQLQFNHPMILKKRKQGVEISSAQFMGVVVFVTVICYAADSCLDLRTYLSTFQKTLHCSWWKYIFQLGI